MANPTKEELAGIKRFRERIVDWLPKDMDNEWDLLRWYRAYGNDPEKLDSILRLLVENRAAVGADSPDLVKLVFENENSRRYGEYMPVSLIDDAAINTLHGGRSVVYFQRAAGVDFNKLLKVVHVGTFLSMILSYNEYICCLVRKQQRQTGQPVTAELVLDIENLNITEYVNPAGAPLQALRCVAYLGDTYYPDIGSDLKNHISLDALPKCYGGTLKDPNNWGDPHTCVKEPKMPSKSDYYPVDRVFSSLPSIPGLSHETIKHGRTFTVIRSVNEHIKYFAYQFRVNNEVEFTVFYVNPHTRTRLRPRLLMVTPKIPEEGFFDCQQLLSDHKDETAELHFEFTNSTCYWFVVKLQYAIEKLDTAPEPLPVIP